MTPTETKLPLEIRTDIVRYQQDTRWELSEAHYSGIWKGATIAAAHYQTIGVSNKEMGSVLLINSLRSLNNEQLKSLADAIYERIPEQSENKRLMELLKEHLSANWRRFSSTEKLYFNKDFKKYWLQYCKDNKIKGE